jgi:hypothetical protein
VKILIISHIHEITSEGISISHSQQNRGYVGLSIDQKSI